MWPPSSGRWRMFGGLVGARRFERRLDRARARGCSRARRRRARRPRSGPRVRRRPRPPPCRRAGRSRPASPWSIAAATARSFAATSSAARLAAPPPAIRPRLLRLPKPNGQLAVSPWIDADLLDQHAEAVGDDLRDAGVVSAAGARDAGEDRDLAGGVDPHRRGVEAADERAWDVAALRQQLEADPDAEAAALRAERRLLRPQRVVVEQLRAPASSRP